MDDRTMLELAAKAIGLDAVMEMYGRAEDGSIFCDANDPPTEWNPLADDNDTFRLIIGTNIKFIIDDEFVNVFKCGYGNPIIDLVERYEDHDGDKLAATRRAITRAAAAIQLAKESK